ncbi:MAG: hypothetical protein ACKVWR_04355 [Acidimicrobiales bacterium]
MKIKQILPAAGIAGSILGGALILAADPAGALPKREAAFQRECSRLGGTFTYMLERNSAGKLETTGYSCDFDTDGEWDFSFWEEI